MTCSRCQKQYGGFFSILSADLAGPNLCPECEELDRHREAQELERKKEVAQRAAKVLLTTTPTIEGHRIAAYLGIESVEIVIGTGFLSELSGDISDFFGQRSKKLE